MSTDPEDDKQPEQVDDPDGYGAWIGQAFERGDDEGWGA